MSTQIIITEPEYVKAQTTFDAVNDFALTVSAPDESSVCAAVRERNAWAVVLGVERYAGELYSVLPRRGVIARFGVGHDGIDKPQATTAGLCVTNTPGVLEDAVCEHVLGLMLGLSKNLARHVTAVQRGSWEPCLGRELRGAVLAIIGCGAIGRRVARAASSGLGMRVVGFDTREAAVPVADDHGFSSFARTFAEAVSDADYVSLHIPGTEENRHFLNPRTLAMLPARATVINTSRGIIVDEDALFEALAAKRLAGAGLDVFEAEPYTPRSRGRDLRTLANVLLTPHISSGTHEACQRVAGAVLRNLRAARAGDLQNLDLVNPELRDATR